MSGRRWIIRLEYEDGGTRAFGSWTSGDTAEHLARKLREQSGHYGGPGPDVAVTTEYVDRWPGLTAMRAEWSAVARSCRFCGKEVTSPDEMVDFCHDCFVAGHPHAEPSPWRGASWPPSGEGATLDEPV